MPNWTNAQLKAIETTDKTLLISAAAGSGKTTVLIERIIRSLTREKDPADISKMLIVTFTRAAAAELRQRISVALSKAIAERPNDKSLFKQLTLLGSAHISTIDSFYSYVVRRNSDKLNISPSLRTVDNEELLPIRKAVMDKVIEQGYLGKLGFPADDFAEMTEMLCDMRNDSSLSDVFIERYDDLLYHPHFIDFLSESASFYDAATESDFFESPIGTVLKEYIVSQIEYCEALLNTICRFFSSGEFSDGKYLPPYLSDLDFCARAKDAALNKGYVATRDTINSYSAERLISIKSADKTPEVDFHIELRKKVKEKIAALKKAYFSYSFSDDEIKAIASTSAARIRMLHAILSEFDRIYSEEKAARGICEFNDVKLWTYKLLVSPDGSPTELALELSQSFDSIYIDEYQDVDLIQDMIFRAISKPRSRFMVGDIKQSIYGFRGAEPSLFMNYRNSFPLIEDDPNSDECTVFMSDNFRCDEPIIKFTNLVCSYIFKTGGKEITYTDSDDLGLAKPQGEEYVPTPVKIALIDTKNYGDNEEDDDEGTSAYGAEEEYIANEIVRLTKNEVKADGKAIEYSDIAVLYRSATFGKKIAKAFDAKGIPHTFGSSENIFECPEVSLTLSLLRIIDNPRRDIPLASALMSPIFGLTAQNIAEINEHASQSEITTLYDRIEYVSRDDSHPLSEKCQSIIKEISEMRISAESLSADRIIRQLYSEYSILSRSDEASSAALTAFYENARSYEGDTFKGLYGYLRYLDDMLDAGKTISYTARCDENSVNFSTIHLSKGLEFPVCFVCGTSIPFNRDDAKKPILYSQKLGIAMDMSDKSGFGRFRTPFRSALSREIYDRSSEEEMRVLYVAFTRARERLYITAKCRHGAAHELENARRNRSAGTRSAILDSSNYISWILTATYGTESSLFHVDTFYASDITAEFEGSSRIQYEESQAEKKHSDSDLEAAKKHIENIFSYKYPYSHISNLPAKLSVSKLSPGVLDRSDDSTEDSSADSLDHAIPRIINTPAFMSDNNTISAAQKGTDTHTYLQFCNFDNAVSFGVQSELERLIRDGFIEKRARKSVDLNQIEAFFSSDLFLKLQKAKSVYREQRFNILLPAAKFTEDEQYARELGDETLLVQGVIDLLFESEDGRLILCDYKTDHLTPAELRDRSLAAKKLTEAHRRQLSYYSAAVTRLFGKAPDEVLIYSLPLGDTVSVIPEIIDLPTERSREEENKK